MTVRDIFEWLDDADAAIGDGTDAATRAYWSYWRASEAKDAEGVRAAREDFIALSKAHNLPWLEVFGRHWDLQHRLVEMGEGAAAVADAVALFEIAHRPENLDCPQTICSAQDLCIAYSRTDGPGYAEEVIAAATDTLDRIDPTWPCFDCVSAELREGLIHAGRHDDAIALIDETEVAIRSQGENPTIGYERARLAALLALDHDEEALRVADTVDPDRFAEHSDWERHAYALQVARARLRGGDVDTAAEAHVDALSPVAYPSTAPDWLLLTADLLRAGAIENGNEPSATIVELAHLLLDRGSYRQAFNAARLATEAAAARGALGSARRAHALAKRISEELVDPSSVADRLAHLDAALVAAPAEIHAAATWDVWIDAWEQAWEHDVLEHEDLMNLVATLADQGWIDGSQDVLWRWIAERPDDEHATMMLFEILLRAQAHDDLDRLVAQVESTDASLAHWFEARRAAWQSRWVDVVEHCAAVVSLEPDVVNTRRLWAEAERRIGNYEAALRLSREVIELGGDDVVPADRWDAMVHGTLVEEWAFVRECAAALDIELEADEGPIEERWERCLITFVDDDGRQRTHTAARTGPVTARIVNVAHPDVPQHFDDDVVFDPMPLDPVPEDPEEAARELRRYAAVSTSNAGGCRSVVIDGAFDDEQWAEFRDSLYEHGFPVWAYQGQMRTMPDGREVEVLPAVVALRPGVSAEHLAELLDSITAAWEPAPAWADLAAELGGDTDLHARRYDALWN